MQANGFKRKNTMGSNEMINSLSVNYLYNYNFRYFYKNM